VTGDLTIHGVTKPVVVKATFLGEGKDPWGGYRAGFEGTTSIKRSDFGKMMDLGPQSDAVDLYVTFEGVKAK
jgi:polyisoprenoid-binding protein YceI